MKKIKYIAKYEVQIVDHLKFFYIEKIDEMISNLEFSIEQIKIIKKKYENDEELEKIEKDFINDYLDLFY